MSLLDDNEREENPESGDVGNATVAASLILSRWININ